MGAHRAPYDASRAPTAVHTAPRAGQVSRLWNMVERLRTSMSENRYNDNDWDNGDILSEGMACELGVGCLWTRGSLLAALPSW